MKVNEITVKKVWKLLDIPKTPYLIGGLSKKKDEAEITGGISTRTAQRLKAALEGFREDASDDEIAKCTKWSMRLVKRLRRWYEKYTREEYRSVRWQNHIQNLLKIAGKIRKRIYNPDTSERTGPDESAWLFGGQDWRFVPNTWISLVMPPLDYGKWKKDFKNLKEHLGNNSLFCQNYDKIVAEADQLSKEFDEAAQGLISDDSDFEEIWSKFHMSTDDYHLYHLKPNKIETMPKDNEIVSLEYPWDSNEEMFDLFADHISDLSVRLDSIEQLLQELWNDLDPDNIRSMVEQGICSECPKS